MPPRVTLITTVYNRARFLETAIRSVLTQTYRDFEYILHDDGSTDGSLDICRRLAAADPRVRVVEAPHQGLVKSLAAANRLAQGELVGWIDSDDLLVKDALEHCIRELDARPDAVMVYTQHVLIDENNRQHGLGRKCLIPYSPEGLLVEFMTHHFRLFRKSIYDAVGGIDESLETSPDYDFCLKVSEAGAIVHLERPLYCYRVHGSSVSTARRDTQIQAAAECVRRALVRRGLADRFTLQIQAGGRFVLAPRG